MDGTGSPHEPERAGGDVRRIGAAALHELSRAAFERAGVPPDEAGIAATVLVETSLRGVDTHGIALLPGYVKRLVQGQVNAHPVMRRTQGRASTAVIDADDGLGVVASYRAMELAIEMARQSGIAMVGVRRSTHFGAGLYYATMALPHDMIGLAASNGPAVMAPHGGSRRALHNMPIAAAVPALEEPPIVMDFAMSVVALRKIATEAREGRPIPFGWALDPSGRPTTDPAEAQRGALLPLGHKGYALGILVDVLAGVLTGAGFADRIPPEADGSGGLQGTGHICVAIDVAAFMPVDEFKARVDALTRHLRAVPPLSPDAPVRVPGERGAQVRRQRAQEGIPVPASLYQRLAVMAAEVGLRMPAG